MSSRALRTNPAPLTGRVPQMFGHHRVLALPLKLHKGNFMLGRRVFERRHKARVIGVISVADGSA
jgi:hypothetical protein